MYVKKQVGVFLGVGALLLVAAVFFLRYGAGAALCPEEECAANADCSAGYYCYRNYSPKCDEETCLSGDAGTYGVCEALDSDSQTIRAGDNTYTVSKSVMSHRSAERFCATHGLKLLALADLACQTPLVNAVALER